MEIHGLVAEAMILANASVGKRIYDGYKDAAILRHHPPPTQGQFERLVKASKSRVCIFKKGILYAGENTQFPFFCLGIFC